MPGATNLPGKVRDGGRDWLAHPLTSPGIVASVVAWVGAGLLLWSAVIHLHLWSQSYHQIPTIGPLFLVQGIAGMVVAVGVAVLRRPLAMAAAALFSLGTIAGLLLSVNVGLFGFRDSLSAPFAQESLVVEAVAAVVLLSAAALALGHGRRPARSSGHPA